MVDEKVDIDLTKFTFASDKLTVKDLRRLYPGQLDNRDVSSSDSFTENSVYEKLAALITEERGMAMNIYDQARGVEREFSVIGDDLEDSIKALGLIYVKFGLATGPAAGLELARSIERQALEQARQHGGTGRA